MDECFMTRDGDQHDNSTSITERMTSPPDTLLTDTDMMVEKENVKSFSDDETGQSITPAQLVTIITNAWQNEICAPRLLPHMENIVDLMIDQLESMEGNFNRCSDHTSLKVILHKMEVQRLAYMTNEYIRTRLKKIENDVEELQNEDIEREKINAQRLLSTTERVFAERFEIMKRNLMDTCFLERIPPALRRLPTTKIDMSKERVIVEVTSNTHEKSVIPEMTDILSERSVDLPPGSIHFIPYPSIANLLEANKVRLL